MHIKINGGLGDDVILTAAVREYSLKHPDERLSLDVRHPEVFLNNPHVMSGSKDNQVFIELCLAPHYDGLAPPLDLPSTIAHYYGKQIGVRVVDPTPEVFLAEGELSMYPRRPNVVALDTWAGWPNRRWPLERFKALVDMLHERGMKVVEVGKSVPDSFRTMRHASLPNVDESLVDRQGIRETAAFFASSGMYLGNESGLVHLAAAVGTPQVVICSMAVSWWTRSYRTTCVIAPLTACKDKPCHDLYRPQGHLCGSPKFCMEDIRPEDVIEACERNGLLGA